MRDHDKGEQKRFSLSTIHCSLAVGRKRPPLCRGCAPATPPYKNIAHRPYARIPAVPLHQPGGCQPHTQRDCPNSGRDEEPVKTGNEPG